MGSRHEWAGYSGLRLLLSQIKDPVYVCFASCYQAGTCALLRTRVVVFAGITRGSHSSFPV